MNARDPHHEPAAPLSQVNATTQRYRDACAAQAQALRRELAELDDCTARAVDAGDLTRATELSSEAQKLTVRVHDLEDKAATGTPPPEAQHHLARFVPLHRTPRAVRWVIPGVIEDGVVTIAGARGVGKTTAILPLALVSAGLHAPGNPLAPKADRWRHVVYISEHTDQVQRILAGVVECSGWGVTWEQLADRLHVVEARRLPIHSVAEVAAFYKTLTRVVDGVEILPLVVFDTQAACFEMLSENDNAEASNIMAALKQQFHSAPIWIVGHVAKDSIGRSDIDALSARGAGAFEADAIQNLYLVKDRDDRFLCIGKTRAEPRHGKELTVTADHKTVTGLNEWGEPEDVHLRWAAIMPMEVSRAELKAQGDAEEERQRGIELRAEILDAVDTGWRIGNPTSKTGIKGMVTGFRDASKGTAIAQLIAEGWLQEIEVPAAIRANNNRKAFLVRLSAAEHEAWQRTGVIPPNKQIIPRSWQKAQIPSVPDQSP